MKHISLIPTTLALATLTLAPQAMAQSGSNTTNDRWEISAAYFEPNMELSGGGHLVGDDGTEIFEAREGDGIDGNFKGGIVEASFQATPRQKIVAGWYRIDRDQPYGFQDTGTYVPGDDIDIDPIDYSVDAHGSLDGSFELYRLGYGYDFIQKRDLTVTGLVGVYGARLEMEAATHGNATVDGETYDWDERIGFDETRHAPGLGLAVSYRPADRWEIRAAAQGFRTDWGDFDTEGHFTHAQAQVGYDFHPNWTVFAGYDWFNLELKDDVDFEADIDGATYTVDGNIEGRLKVHGPTLGLRASF